MSLTQQASTTLPFAEDRFSVLAATGQLDIVASSRDGRAEDVAHSRGSHARNQHRRLAEHASETVLQPDIDR